MSYHFYIFDEDNNPVELLPLTKQERTFIEKIIKRVTGDSDNGLPEPEDTPSLFGE